MIRHQICVVFGVLSFSWICGPAQAQKKKAPDAKPAPIRLPAAVLKPHEGTVMDVARIDRSNREAIEAAAKKIDGLLESHWSEHEVMASPRLKDDQFLRRVYLELGGRIPTLQETNRFLDTKGDAKRGELVDALLESPDYVSHTYNFWADILRLTERPQNNIFFEPYLDYVKNVIRENKPFDKWVFEMLTADGKVWENPAVGFQLRDDGMPLPYIDNTVRVFLGTQIGCAQCHDHPFDHWTQRQFYELAAFTSGTRTRLGGKDPEYRNGNTVNLLLKEAKEKAPGGKVNGSFQQMLRANSYVVRFTNQPMKLPHDYAYSDAKPSQVVKPKVLWGEPPPASAKLDHREALATWMTGRDNRQFAKTIANRLWKRMMGVGIVEPIDDFRDDNQPLYPQLLEHLTDEMFRLDFDTREFIRIICSTEAYQRRAVIHDPTSGQVFRFPSPALKRMTAEQLWDSILTLVAYDTWAFQRPDTAEFAKAVNLNLANVSLTEAEKVNEQFQQSFQPNAYARQINKNFGYKGQVLVRASELPTPLPLGHFLRQFGQSDRTSIEGGRTVATIPQILTIFNGPITHIMLERGSVIYDNVIAAGQAKAVDVIFHSILSRRPSGQDRKLAVNEIITAEKPAAGYGNLIWSLLNTREFIFIQ